MEYTRVKIECAVGDIGQEKQGSNEMIHVQKLALQIGFFLHLTLRFFHLLHLTLAFQENVLTFNLPQWKALFQALYFGNDKH